MDTTTNNQNPQQPIQQTPLSPGQSVQPVSLQQQPTSPMQLASSQPVEQINPSQPFGNAYPDQLGTPSQQSVQQSMPNVPPQPSQPPISQPVMQPQPIPMQQVSQPVMPQTSPDPQNAIYQQTQTTPSYAAQPITPTENSPKITLDDLYGPSGFVHETTDPLSPQRSSVQTLPPAATSPQEMPNMSESIPNLPIISQEVASGSTHQEPIQPGPEQPSASSPLSAMPLRKGVFHDSEQTDGGTPPPTPPSPPDSKETPSGGLNKLKVLRFLFGGLGVLVFLVVILFVVQYLSAILHPSTTSSKVTLVYWGLWEDSNTMQPIISEFEREHPNITIDYEKQDPKQYTQRLLTRIKQGNGPDIFRFHSSWLPMLQPVLAPLPTSVISKQELQNNFYPVVRNDLVKNGALYGIALEVDTLSLFVNTTLFQNAKAPVPTTWDAFTTTARALTVKDANGKIKVAGAAFGTYDNITHAPDILAALFAQNGVNLQTITPSSNAADALTFYTSFATGDSNVWDNTLDPSMLAFARGNLAMYFGYSWDVFLIKASNPNLSFSVYPIPHLPGRNTTTASYWVEGVSTKSQHQKEALEFMHFLTQKSTEATLYTEESKTRLFGEPYARSDLGNTLQNNPLVYPFIKQANNATSSFFAGETDDTSLNGQMNSYLGNAVRSVLNGTSAQSAIDTLTKGVQQIEKQYGS